MGCRSFFECCLDVVFPPFCVSCHGKGEWWCGSCRGAVERLAGPPVIEGLDGTYVAGYYHDPRLRAAIHALKYRGVTALAADLESFLQSRSPPCGPIAIQHLPGAPYRIRERGFDQAELLADLLLRVLPAGSFRVDFLVRERESGIAQASIERQDLRSLNVSGAFRFHQNGPVPKQVLLLDDVITTGSTMRVAVDVLRAHGAERVFGYALALGA